MIYDDIQKKFDESQFDGRLQRALQSSYRAMEPYRKIQLMLIQEYAGPRYNQEKSNVEKLQYLNMLQQAIDTWKMTIIPNNPQILVSTGKTELQAFARHFQIAVNNLLKKINFAETASSWVVNALFGLGVVKCHMADSGRLVTEGDVTADPGMPFASVVSLDDFVYDTSAKREGLCRFFGDQYRISYQEMMENDQYYNIDLIKKMGVKATSKQDGNYERADRISTGYETDADEFEPMVDLCDIYIPSRKMIYTYVVENRGEFRIEGSPIAEMEWEGSELGPYTMMSFIDVPDNIMPASMAESVSALSRLINNLMRKSARQAVNQKTIYAVDGASQQDVNNIKGARDRSAVKSNNPEGIKPVVFPGADPGNQATMNDAIQKFDRMAGNLSAMAGLGAQADTAKQEQIISEAASKKEMDMSNVVNDGLRKLISDLGLMLWSDDFMTIPAQIDVEGLPGFTTDATWRPDERAGDFLDFNFDIDVYSMVPKTPAQRLKAITEFVGMLMNMGPAVAEQGGMIDMQVFVNIFSELINEPRLLQLVKFDRPPMDPSLQPVGPQTKVATGMNKPNGNYTRTNVNAGEQDFSNPEIFRKMSNQTQETLNV